MELLKPNTQDAAEEKHVPVIKKDGENVTVIVGETPHPMEKKHYIEWIELLTDTKIYRKHLKPGQKPKAEFKIKESEKLSAREYCNVHGLWQNCIEI